MFHRHDSHGTLWPVRQSPDTQARSPEIPVKHLWIAPRLILKPRTDSQKPWMLERLSAMSPPSRQSRRSAAGRIRSDVLAESNPCHLAATGAGPFVQDEMRHLHLDFRKLDLLVGVVGSKVLEGRIAENMPRGESPWSPWGSAGPGDVPCALFWPLLSLLLMRLFAPIGTVR
jgi:hypothetical protein